MSNETPYQVGPQVAQLQAERANAEAYGNEPRVAQIDRQLEHLGVKKAAAEKRAEAEPEKRTAPRGRRAKEAEQTTAKEE